MSKREYLARYSLIIKKVRKAPADFESIYDYLERESEIQGYNFRVSKRTFQRDLDDIRSMYDIDIQYDFSRKVYYISEEPASDANIRMLESFDLFQAFKLTENISEHISFEKRKSQGTQYLLNLLQAIKNQQTIQLYHQKFDANSSVERILEPLAIKESKGRWYLVANNPTNGTIKTYGLDRITDLIVQKQRFEAIEFDVNQYFKYCFGIIRPIDEEPEEIVLSFTPYQGAYIKTLPMHDTQQVLADNETELKIKLTLYITFELMMELCSFGESVRVIEPLSLAEKLNEIYVNSSSKYIKKSKCL